MLKKLLIKERYNSQRGWFAYEIYNQMVDNPDIWLVVGDLGWGMWDKVKRDFPDRFINSGAAEQAMMGVGIGLALKGKIPFVYSITPFLLYRCFETIRNYLDHENISVKLAGAGRDKDYLQDGFSHWSEEAKQVLDCLPNITQFWPAAKDEIPYMLNKILTNNKPSFISLTR